MTTEKESEEDRKLRKKVSIYHTRVLTALLDPYKEHNSASQIAEEYNDHYNRGKYSEALNDFIEAGEVFRDNNGIYHTFVDKNNKFVHAFWRISNKKPNLLIDQIRAINKDKHIRSFYKNAIDSEVAQIIRDCKLSPDDLKKTNKESQEEKPDDANHPVK